MEFDIVKGLSITLRLYSIYAFWKALNTEDNSTTLRYGIVAIFLLVMSFA